MKLTPEGERVIATVKMMRDVLRQAETDGDEKWLVHNGFKQASEYCNSPEAAIIAATADKLTPLDEDATLLFAVGYVQDLIEKETD